MPNLTDTITRTLDLARIERRHSPVTLDDYRRDLAHLHGALAALTDTPPTLADLTTARIRAWLAAQSVMVSVATYARRLAAVRFLCRTALREGWLTADPTALIRRPQVPRPLPRAIDREILMPVLDGLPTRTPEDRRVRAILEVGFATGLRLAELAGLRLSDIDRRRGLVLVRRGKGGRPRTAAIGQRALVALDAYEPDRQAWAPHSDALFVSVRGAALRPNGLARAVRRWRQAAGGEVAALTCHVLRHSCGTAMLEGGADLRDVQAQLGHIHIQSTVGYTKITAQRLRAAYAKAHPRAA